MAVEMITPMLPFVATTDLSPAWRAGGSVPTKAILVHTSIGVALATMPTSIQVSRELHEKLKELKQRMGVETFEELLTRLIERPRQASRARFGTHPGMRPFAHWDGSHRP